MPPKSCICCICSTEVLKSTTYEVSPGKRACKSHEGVEPKRPIKTFPYSTYAGSGLNALLINAVCNKKYERHCWACNTAGQPCTNEHTPEGNPLFPVPIENVGLLHTFWLPLHKWLLRPMGATKSTNVGYLCIKCLPKVCPALYAKLMK